MSFKKDNVLILISGENVGIWENGICMRSVVSEWDSDTEEDILNEYLSKKSKRKGGER